MYKLKNITHNNLIEQGFKYIGYDCYQLRFPVMWYKNNPTAFCNATICPTEGKRIHLEVYHSNGLPYEQWFTKNYIQAASILHKIDKSIDIKMHKIGARKYKDKE